MRACALFLTLLFSAAIGCGDGVGHPIVSGALLVHGAAGTGGAASGAGGTAGIAPAAAGLPAETPELGGMAGVAGPGGAAGRRSDFHPPDGPDGVHPVPEGDLCRPVGDWDDMADAAERELLQELNIARYYGVACDGGEKMVAPAVVMRPELRCAARLHSRAMSEGNFCDHVNLEERIRATGYLFGVASESIFCNEPRVKLPPREVLTRLVEAGGSECKNLVDSRFNAVGIGLFEDRWTLDFAGP